MCVAVSHTSERDQNPSMCSFSTTPVTWAVTFAIHLVPLVAVAARAARAAAWFVPTVWMV